MSSYNVCSVQKMNDSSNLQENAIFFEKFWNNLHNLKNAEPLLLVVSWQTVLTGLFLEMTMYQIRQ